MRASLFLIPLILSSAACSQPEEYRDEVGVAATDTPTATAGAEEAEPASMEEQTDRYSFAYSWPREVSAETALAEELRNRANRMKTTLAEEANRDFAEAEGEEWVARPHSSEVEWTVVADLPDWLSLSGELSTYSGGAHGNHGKMSLVWDRQKKLALEGIDLFASPVELDRALGEKLCNALNAKREERRGSPVDPDSDDPFNACPGVDQATVLVGSSNGKTFDRIGVYFGPYIAGPYAEGDFELDFSVTGAVLDAVKPEYASAFSVKRQ